MKDNFFLVEDGTKIPLLTDYINTKLKDTMGQILNGYSPVIEIDRAYVIDKAYAPKKFAVSFSDFRYFDAALIALKLGVQGAFKQCTEPCVHLVRSPLELYINEENNFILTIRLYVGAPFTVQQVEEALTSKNTHPSDMRVQEDEHGIEFWTGKKWHTLFRDETLPKDVWEPLLERWIEIYTRYPREEPLND